MAYILGIDPSVESSTDDFGVGTTGANETTDGTKEYIWARANASGVTAAGYVVVLDEDFVGDMADATATTPGTGAGKRVAIPEIAVTASYYAWFQIAGNCSIRASASCAKYTQLTVTATPGELDDATTSGLEVINGAVLDTAVGGGGSATSTGMIQYPVVGRTL